ncbi:hypothetical protein ABZP36_025444 [Zizania latifolia]
MVVSLAAAALLAIVIVVPLLCILLLPIGKRSAALSQRGGDGRRRQLPPSPRGLPLLGHLHLLGALPHRALRSLAVAHGQLLLLRLGRVLVVLVSSAAAAEETRRICTVHLLNTWRVLPFRHIREQEATVLVDRVRATGGAAFDLIELLIAYSSTVISRNLYDDVDRGRELKKVFSDFEELLGTEPVGELLPWLRWVDTLRGLEGKVQRTFKALDGVLEKVIDDHRHRRECDPQMGADSNHRDFVDVLLDVNKMDMDAGIQLDTIEIKAIILYVFAAGTATTTTAIQWAIAELITHPHAMRKAQYELQAVVGTASRVTEDDVDRLSYLKAMLKETLLLHPPIPFLMPRELLADAEILGYSIPARTRVVKNASAIGRDPVAWGEHAEEFSPERFMDSNMDYKGHNFELVPFGAGRRGCPGVVFAEQTIEMALASLLYHFDWEVATVANRRGSPAGMSSLDMSEINGISIRLKYGLPLVAKPRFP